MQGGAIGLAYTAPHLQGQIPETHFKHAYFQAKLTEY